MSQGNCRGSGLPHPVVRAAQSPPFSSAWVPLGDFGVSGLACPANWLGQVPQHIHLGVSLCPAQGRGLPLSGSHGPEGTLASDQVNAERRQAGPFEGAGGSAWP